MIPLEDNIGDIIGKAQHGLRLTDIELAEKARVDPTHIHKLRGSDFDELIVWRIAPVLNLAARALCDLAAGNWHPGAIELDGLAQFTTHYHGMGVNAYLVWDPKSREAVVFDTGADCGEILSKVEKEKLTVKLILLTHAHSDHIADLARLVKETGAPVYLSERESAPIAQPIPEGKKFKVGKLDIESRLTWGHSKGGMTYVVTGLKRPVAVVGDSLFAGSMGGGAVSYNDALKNNLEKILTLPDETILCPGHGPMTTVGEEKEHNPFFSGQV
jgi:glyoxylase-like metal-dependent hydrolase (beta-lactamase superfamily II)